MKLLHNQNSTYFINSPLQNNIDIPSHTGTVEINLNKSRDNINTEFNLIIRNNNRFLYCKIVS